MLVAFAGFGGAGKTTAMQYLQAQGFGRRVYLGQCVLDEINARALTRTPQVEEDVRIELRCRLGPSAFADLRSHEVVELIKIGENVLVDAIFKIEEYEALRACGQDRSMLVSIDASFETRSRRLEERINRRYTPEELHLRDETEIKELGTLEVLNAADLTISNERTLPDFYSDLTAFWERLSV